MQDVERDRVRAPGAGHLRPQHIADRETAFLLPRADGLDVRYFSPLAEVPFCGHATIALAVAYAERHGPGTLRLRTVAGEVPVRAEATEDGAWTATLTSVEPSTAPLEPADRAALLELLGLTEEDLDPALPPRTGYAGAWHPVLALATRERLAVLDYDLAALGRLMADRQWTTVALVWRQDDVTFSAPQPVPAGRRGRGPGHRRGGRRSG